MRPLAIMLGTPRDARARRKFGQSSVSIPTKKRGRTASRARRTGPRQVDRKIPVRRDVPQLSRHDAGAGRRDGGDDDAQSGPAPSDAPDERRGRRRLAHRDGVDPAARLRGQPRLDPPEPLPEVMPVASSPEPAKKEERASMPQAPAPASPNTERTSAAGPRGPLMRTAREGRLDLPARRLLRAAVDDPGARGSARRSGPHSGKTAGECGRRPRSRAATPTTPRRRRARWPPRSGARGPRYRASRPPPDLAARPARPRPHAPLRAIARGAGAPRRRRGSRSRAPTRSRTARHSA